MTWKILVAEDDPNTRAALVEILRGESYQVAEAADGMQAKSLFEQQPPDIACLDVADDHRALNIDLVVNIQLRIMCINTLEIRTRGLNGTGGSIGDRFAKL